MATYEELMTELKAGKYRPVYLLMGEEPYYIDVIADYIEANALDEGEKAFNQTVFYGKDTDGVAVAHEASQYPMMSQRRVVIVKEAQNLDKFAKLESYVEHLQETTVLVLCHKYKSVDKRLKITKLIEKNGAVMETKKMWDNQMPAWISSYAVSQHLQIDQKASALMAEALGTNISAIVSAFEKLKVAAGNNLKTITVDLVSDNIGISKEYNTLELREALFARNVSKVNRIVKAFGLNEKANPIQSVIPTLFGAFEKLYAYHFVVKRHADHNPNSIAQKLGEKPYTIQRLYETGARNYNANKCLAIINLLREYDMRSKGFAWPAVGSGELLKELMFRIMN